MSFMTNRQPFKQKKRELVATLYMKQGHICPLCKHTMAPELDKWTLWVQKKVGKDGKRYKRKDIDLNIDHVIPVSEGGSNDLDNLALTHWRCNDLKRNLLVYKEAPRR